MRRSSGRWRVTRAGVLLCLLGSPLCLLGPLLHPLGVQAQDETHEAAPGGEAATGEVDDAEPSSASLADDAQDPQAEPPEASEGPSPAVDEPETADPERAPGSAEDERRRPAAAARTEDAEAYTATESGSVAAAVLGTSTIVFGVVTAAMLGYFLDRTGQRDTCAAAEAFEESERGCVNRRLIESQQEIGLGLFIGTVSAFAVLATSWAIVTATDGSDDPEAASLRCAPGLASLSCVGQF